MKLNTHKKYSLRKCRKILRHNFSLYKRKKSKLAQSEKETLQTLFESLQRAISEKNKEEASEIADNLDHFASQALKKNLFDQILDLFFALLFALAVAIVVRQMWFELYTIPTGSMRPTLKENDYLVVSKTDFGINTPTRTSHLYFNPDLVKRGQIVIFSGANMDIRDVDTMYFYLIPGKKQFVKRLIGKPGDTIYFYGGHLYGFDSNGKEIEEYKKDPCFQTIEHIPFIRFDGKAVTPQLTYQGIYSPVLLYQMDEAVAKLSLSPTGKLQGEMLSLSKQGSFIDQYYDLWGFKNFAMARILTPSQAKSFFSKPLDADTPLYLEIIHHPAFPPVIAQDEYGRLRPSLHISHSLIPLNEKHIDELFNHIYTGRFNVNDQHASRLGASKKGSQTYLPKLNVPDGCYEFDNGTAYKVYPGGITKKLSPSHPLCERSIDRLLVLYNLGIEFDTRFEPEKNQSFFPSRYAYFRDGSLYLLGHPIFHPGDPSLASLTPEQTTNASFNATPLFVDNGPPLKNGEIDKEFIQKFGLKIPDRMYLVLGDNHAMSADSRDFGFVPQDNLRGGASFIFWPPGSRWGKPFQLPTPWMTFPNIAVWSGAFVVIALSWYIIHKKRKKPLKFD